MVIGITVALYYCSRCSQMTNHKKETHNFPENKTIVQCLKCNADAYVLVGEGGK